MKTAIILATITSLFFSGCTPKNDMPSREKISASIKSILPVNHSIIKATPLNDIPGLIEVVVAVDKQKVVFYIDKSLKYAFSGSLLEISTKKNLTAEVQKASN